MIQMKTGAASAGTGASAMTAEVGARRFWERKEWHGDGGARERQAEDTA